MKEISGRRHNPETCLHRIFTGHNPLMAAVHRCTLKLKVNAARRSINPVRWILSGGPAEAVCEICTPDGHCPMRAALLVRGQVEVASVRK